MCPVPLIKFEHVNSVVRGKYVLNDICWTVTADQNWVIIGPNGAGKTSLLNIILGKLYYRGNLHLTEGLRQRTAYVSFARHSRLIQREVEKDHARHFSGNPREGLMTAARLLNILPEDKGISPDTQRIVDLLGIDDLMEKEIRQLSTGEMRKLLIAEALLASPRLLVLDEPYDGLDSASARSLIALTDRLMAAGIQVVLVTHRFEEIPARIAHVLCMKNGRVYRQGKKTEIIGRPLIQALYGARPLIKGLPDKPRRKFRTVFDDDAQNLIRMRNVTVKYGKALILDGIDWQVDKRENWYIYGPNGAGKSTLLSLVTADNPQAYANEVYLFGKRRGTGETIWDIKQKIGLISSEFQIRYRLPTTPVTAYQVVLSGFYDSVGLFRQASREEQDIARQWLHKLSLEAYGERRFDHLSDGEQRLILMVRAMVKSPAILVLDEPFQGVDYVNRNLLLNLIDTIGQDTETTVIYVTHQQEKLTCITHTLEFLPNERGGYRLAASVV